MLRILKRTDDGDMVRVGSYTDGSFNGTPEITEAFGALEGGPEEEIMRSLDGPRLIAVKPEPNEADLANRYEEGDVVSTPNSGFGVIAGVITENKEAPADGEFDDDYDDIEASPDSPTYVVVTEDDSDSAFGLFKASDIRADTIETDVDALDSTKDAAAAMTELAPGSDPEDKNKNKDMETAELRFRYPKSWRESSTPARVIALKAFAGMGGSFTGCVETMTGDVRRPNAFCGSFIDRALGYKYWRGDSPLPGD